MTKKLFAIVLISVAFLACGKQNEWLDAKRQASDVVPGTLDDYQAILDNTMVMNTNYPTLGLIGCDNFYYADESIGALSFVNKNTYYWNKDIFGTANSSDYSNAYAAVANANIVLEGLLALETSTPGERAKRDEITGQALFFRSIMFYELASVFCKPFVSVTADKDLGISIRLKSDIHHIEQRSSVKRTYDQIVNDLIQAVKLLPVTPLYKTRPSKPAAFALLARTYLLQEDYAHARDFSDSALQYSNELLDFNSSEVSLSKPYRFPDFYGANKEIVFYASGLGNVAIVPSESQNGSYVDSTLYKSYGDMDLRKLYFYDLIEPNKAKFRGSLTGSDRTFSGIGNSEVYFIRAESNARLGQISLALADLNKVLIKRYKTGSYADFTSTNSEEVLRKILTERRKEFPFTGQIRWQDLRRLNKDARFATTLQRYSFGELFKLEPNDRKYTYPFPLIEIEQGGLEQNER